jgi:uncharacterized protein (TIGR00369 family)
VNSVARKYGVVPADIRASYDGLTFLQKIASGEFPQPPIGETVGFALIEAAAGRAVFAGVPQERHLHPGGHIHAGFAMTLLDSAVACAVISTTAKGEFATTLEFKANMVRALLPDTGPVRAEGKIIYRGRTTATAEGQLTDASGKLYAHATTTCMIMPLKG